MTHLGAEETSLTLVPQLTYSVFWGCSGSYLQRRELTILTMVLQRLWLEVVERKRAYCVLEPSLLSLGIYSYTWQFPYCFVVVHSWKNRDPEPEPGALGLLFCLPGL